MTTSSLFNLVGRCAAALAVAFFASIAAFLSVLPLSPSAGSAAVGFVGVFLGGLCLERRSRLIGSLLLTVVGSAFYLQLAARMQFEMKRFDWSDMTFPLMPGLAIGGLTASVVGACWRRETQPTNSSIEPPPSSGFLT
jgi:hypothetical protein